MANSVGSVSIDLEARIAKFESDLGRAARIAEQRSAEMRATLGKVAAVLGAGISVAGITSWVKSAIDAQDELSKLSQKVSVSTGTLSGWQLAAKQAGVDSAGLQTGLVKLAKAADAATQGGAQQAAAFKAIGVSVTDASGKLKPMQKLFEDVSDRLSRYKDSTEKTVIATQLFGKAGADLIPLINGGKQGLEEYVKTAEDFGLAVDGKAAKAAERFNDSVAQLGLVSKGVANQLATSLAPAMADLSDKAVAFFRSETWKSTLDAIATGAKYVADHVEDIITAMKLLGEIIVTVYATKAIRYGTEWIANLIAQTAATNANTAAQMSWGQATAASFAEAKKNIGLLGIALNVAAAALVGWQIGSYLREQFAIVRQAADYAIWGVLGLWEKLKEGAQLAWIAIKESWIDNVALMTTAFYKFGEAIAATLQSGIVPGMKAAGAAMAAALEINEGKSHDKYIADKTKSAIEYMKVTMDTDASLKKMGATFTDMIANEGKTEAAIKKTSVAANAQTESFGKMGGAAKAATDAFAHLNELVQKAQVAARGDGGKSDTLLNRQAADILAIVNEGAKLIASGQSIAAVQARVATGVDAVNEKYVKQAAILKAQTIASIKEYNDAADAQVEALQRSVNAEIARIGMGDKAYQQQQKLNDIMQRGADEIARYVAQRNKLIASDPSADTTALDAQIAKQKEATASMAARTSAGFEMADAARAKWSNGLSSALTNYADQAADVAGQSQTLFANAFNGMGDALANFVTTGKLNFKGLVSSILSDLAKMEMRILASQALQSIMYSMAGSTVSGSQASAWGKQEAWGNMAINANGGVYSSPSLSAYSGQVVSKPTTFAFAHGAGLMGEAGPEAIIPLKRGNDGKLGISGGGGSNVSVVIENHSGAPATAQQSKDANGNDLIKVIIGAVVGEVDKRIARGGSTGKVIQQTYGVSRRGIPVAG